MPYPERGERIRAHLKRALVDPVKEVPEHAPPALWAVRVDIPDAPGARPLLVPVIVQDDRRGRLSLQHLPQHRPRGRGALLVVVASTQLHQDLRPPLDDVGQGEGLWFLGPRWRAEAEDV